MKVFGGESIGTAFDRAGGRSSGFDYLRIFLAASVLLWHSFRISDVTMNYDGWWGPIVRLILPMFFALSGFLVAGSLVRVHSFHQFLLLRAMRIVPALAVEVTLSAVIIGGFFTTLPLADYFAHPMFRGYFVNILGYTKYLLPGVFDTNPVTAFNASLWTIFFELLSYLIIAGLWIIGAIRRPRLLIPLVLIGQCVVPVIDHFQHHHSEGLGPVSGYTLVVAFLFGTVLFIRRDTVPLRTSWALAALAVTLALLSTQATGFFAGPTAAYFTAWLGLRNPRRNALIDSGDYSYGLYLYAYPIQQAITALFPGARVWWFNAPLALLVAGGMAVLSWHLVERPVLNHRRSILGWGDAFVDRFRRKANAPRS